jgi:hypothetical protein
MVVLALWPTVEFLIQELEPVQATASAQVALATAVSVVDVHDLSA